MHIQHITADFLPIDGSDYVDPSLLSSDGIFATYCVSFFYVEMDVTSMVQDDVISGRNKSQFRLYFNYVTNGDGLDDFVSFYPVERTGYEPELLIKYY